MIHAALSCVGIKEVGPDNCGLEVELFQSTVSKPEAQSWCLSFLQSLIAFSESAYNVESHLPATESVSALWDSAPGELKLVAPMVGAIVCWAKNGSTLGHCGLVVGLGPEGIFTVEGNTNDGATLEREGDGVYLRARPRTFKTMHELGFLRVFNP